MTSSSLEPLAVKVTSEQPEKPLPYGQGQFICSATDISLHRKVNLHDAEVVRMFKKDLETYVQGIPKILQMTQKILDILTW